MKQLKIGVLGMSEGNGHPYSWAAIFNGYDAMYMKDCPFPVIPDYLSKQSFPADAIPNAKVTHVWTQEKAISKHIAQSSKIENIVEYYEDMIGKVDAVLLARDDAERHLEMSKSFIEAGIPIFIDKPLALSLKEAMQMLDLEKYTGQVFSCSSLLYANEYDKSKLNHDKVGNLTFSEAIVPKKWTTYSVHIIEPLLNLIGNQGKITKVTNTGKGEINIVTVHWESGHVSLFKTTGSTVSPLKLTIYGDKGFQEFTFQDSFSAFKKSLEIFVESIRKKSCPIPRENTMRVIEIIEKGNIK